MLLARWLDVKSYGAFAVSFALFLLLGAIHSTLLVEPMLVFGPGKYANTFVAYVRGLIRAHWVISTFLIAGGVMTGATLVMIGDRILGIAVLSMSVAVPSVLLAWLVRRAFYVVDAVRNGAVVSTVYGAVLLLILSATHHYNWTTPAAAFVSLALAGIAASAVAWLLLGVGAATGHVAMRDIAASHYPYSRWALASALVIWLPSNAIVVVLPLLMGLAASATLRAALNIVTPAQTVWTALGLMLLPALVRAGNGGDLKLLRYALGLCAVLGIVFWIALGTFGAPVLHRLYQGRYADASSLLTILGAYPLITGVQVAFEMVFRARQQPRLVFYAWLCTSALIIPITAALVRPLGLLAAATGIVASYAGCATVLAFLLVRRPVAAGGAVQALKAR